MHRSSRWISRERPTDTGHTPLSMARATEHATSNTAAEARVVDELLPRHRRRSLESAMTAEEMSREYGGSTAHAAKARCAHAISRASRPSGSFARLRFMRRCKVSASLGQTGGSSMCAGTTSVRPLCHSKPSGPCDPVHESHRRNQTAERSSDPAVAVRCHSRGAEPRADSCSGSCMRRTKIARFTRALRCRMRPSAARLWVTGVCRQLTSVIPRLSSLDFLCPSLLPLWRLSWERSCSTTEACVQLRALPPAARLAARTAPASFGRVLASRSARRELDTSVEALGECATRPGEACLQGCQ